MHNKVQLYMPLERGALKACEQTYFSAQYHLYLQGRGVYKQSLELGELLKVGLYVTGDGDSPINCGRPF